MLYRSLAAALVLFVVGGIVLAETYRGVITKISDKEVTMKVFKDKKDKEGEEKTFKVSKDVKIQKRAGKDKEPEKATADDITEAIKKAGKTKGVFGSVKTEGEGDKETATEVTFSTFGGKKKKDKKDTE